MYVKASGIRGLGEYPGYYCYDANRPGILPYWIDSITESECKWNPATIAGNIKACVTGDPSCGDPTPAQANPNLSGPGVAPPGALTNVPTCTGLYSLDPNSNTCTLQLTTPLLLGAAGFALAFALLMGGRR